MNSFDVYDCFKTVHGYRKVKVKEYNNFVVQAFQEAENQIEIYSGELASFTPELADKIKLILRERNNLTIKVTAGDKILAEKSSDGHRFVPLIRVLKEVCADNKSIKSTITFNHLNLDEQLRGGYFHSIIVDDGVYVMMEEPHNYSKGEKREREYFEDATELASDLKQGYDQYAELYGLVEYDEAALDDVVTLRPKLILRDELAPYVFKFKSLKDNYSLISEFD